MNGRSDGNLAHAKGPVPSMNFHAATILVLARSTIFVIARPRQSFATPTPTRGIFCTTSDGRRGAAKPVRAQAGR
jgi:hypothetical protein